MARTRFSRVLVAVDGSQVSLRAVAHASDIAKADDAALTALHVIPRPSGHPSGGLAEYFDEARSQARLWLKEVESIGMSNGASLRTEVVVGASSVVDCLLAYAEAESIDLIVTGTRGRTPSNRILVGSVASGLVEYAHCAVLVIR